MLVDAAQFPAPAMWQGLMLIAIAVWLPWLFSSKSPNPVLNPPNVFLAGATFGVSLFVWWMS